MEEPTPTPGVVVEKPTPTPEVKLAPAQEVAIIENYAATRFFPGRIVVLKDVLVRLYLTRLHAEHINKFTIGPIARPFLRSTQVILPGEIGVIEFLPDQVGEFRIANTGHGFQADLVVVETMEEAKKRIAETGTQEFALIHSLDDFRIFPERLVVQKGIPVKIYNISLIADDRVSIVPFYVPGDINVRPKEITTFELTPDRTGEFTIRHEIHGFTGEIIVEDSR